MLAYATIGTADLERAKAFYNALFEDIDAGIVADMERLVVYGNDKGGASFCVCTPFDEGAPSPGNGNMLAIPGGSREMVDKLYARALELGATDEGAPGQRVDGFYGGYFRDLDGNKICFCDFS